MSQLLGALCAVFILSSSVFAQAKLDYRQQKELKDAVGYLDEVEGYLGGMDDALKKLKPGDAGVPIQTVEALKSTSARATQRLGYANDRLTKLPATNADVKAAVDRHAALTKALADTQPRIVGVAGGAEKAVQQGSGDAYAADFARLKDINQMFDDANTALQRPAIAIDIVKQIPHVKKERARIADKYGDLLKQDTPASRDMKSVLAYFDQQFGQFDQAAQQYAKNSPASIDQELAQVNKLVKTGVENKSAAFFTPDGGIHQSLTQAQAKLDLLAAINPDAAKAPGEKLKATRDEVAKAHTALLDEIVKTNPAPQTNYTGGDVSALVGIVKDKWSTSGNPAPVLASGINSNAWQRATRWEWDGTSTWNKVDRSKIQGYVVVKATETVANVYYINLDKDHLAGAKITAHFFTDPKQDPGVVYKVLVSKVK